MERHFYIINTHDFSFSLTLFPVADVCVLLQVSDKTEIESSPLFLTVNVLLCAFICQISISQIIHLIITFGLFMDFQSDGKM